MELRNDLSPGEVWNYIRGHSDSQQVDINRHHWGSALFTAGASSCFVPVVFDGAGLLGLGHYYSSLAIPGVQIMNYQMEPLQDYSSFVCETGEAAKQGRKLEMYLFGGTVGHKDYLEEVREAILSKFTDLGVQCRSVLPPELQTILELIVADVRNRTISYSYKLYK
ncbi:hypothetical protein A3J19_02335 [Candidatus Daviesbacteria bacterium RIFCSPLOWO2_02_FULL_41_8]|uniref:Uncharacterized protein n=2 Tax=Candidatus Daviesiibacteriota TaxID=1752718 RepID=A0A1F5NIJ2_9BACT|nr:MAG: hypothetical protein A3D83_01125 [Candidatus Daviesbacteria bacterium RIFCSPHIGHO2_02_FULL_41_10]OGE77438.1 MAG: hypothetical protein A3J19_02335 [Candidatus Daviesbacteria bacterium RIFCSPLOWO2_02_FULL_41_8]